VAQVNLLTGVGQNPGCGIVIVNSIASGNLCLVSLLSKLSKTSQSMKKKLHSLEVKELC
jgi:hypothetical protein